jgi:hypothetical protein
MHRFYLVFAQSRRWIVLPALLYASSLGSSVTSLVPSRVAHDIIVAGSLALSQLSIPGITQKAQKLANWLVIYRTISLSLGIILTSLITGRLIFLHRLPGSLCRSPRSPFLGIAAMLVESAALETVSTLIYIITVGIASPLQNVFLPVLGQVQVSMPIIRLPRFCFWYR